MDFVELVSDVHAPRAARRHVRAECEASGVGEEMTDTAVLLTSELVTNAVVHGSAGPVQLAADGEPQRVQVDVLDGNALPPVLRPLSERTTTGRGLAMVDALASAWGVHPHHPGKDVWFVLDERPGASRTAF